MNIRDHEGSEFADFDGDQDVNIYIDREAEDRAAKEAVGECTEAPDHVTRTTYQDDKVWQGECIHCGAEFWEDEDGATHP